MRRTDITTRSRARWLRATTLVLCVVWCAVAVQAGDDDAAAKGDDAKNRGREHSETQSRPEPDRAGTKLAVYVPPSRGRAAVRAGGATRARARDLPEIAALAPDHVGLTTRAQPSLSWYVSEATDTRLDFTVIDDEGIDPLVEITLSGPIKPGIHAVRLADLGVELTIGRNYAWYVTLVPDPIRRSSDVIAGGAIRRVEITPALRERLASAEPDYAVYASQGIWYDAIADLEAALTAGAGDPDLPQQHRAFMQQIGLGGIDGSE